MKTINLKYLDLTLYHEKLKNGLEIYIIPKNNVNNVYVTFSTKYGSNQIEFIPIEGKKMIKVPLGIAHFLEHKLFEQNKGPDPFTFFSERGSDANANTNQIKTTYLFSGPNFVIENLNFLLDYVQSPYFTDKNVEKEKGIITQEIKMYQDDPDTVLYESIIYNCFNQHPMKYPIIGDIKSINSITKEDLYNCYNTFYHPSNMFVVITGNVDTKEIIDVIKENQEKKDFPKPNKIILKKYKEADEVAKKQEEKNLNVAINKCAIAYKIKIDDNSLFEKISYLITFFDIKLGSTSILYNQLIKEQILSGNIYIYHDNTDNHVVINIFGTSKQPHILLERIQKEIKNIDVKEEEFNRKKKTLLSSLLYISDNIFSLNSIIVNNIVRYHKVEDFYDKTQKLNYNDFMDFIQTIDISNYTTFIINPK